MNAPQQIINGENAHMHSVNTQSYVNATMKPPMNWEVNWNIRPILSPVPSLTRSILLKLVFEGFRYFREYSNSFVPSDSDWFLSNQAISCLIIALKKCRLSLLIIFSQTSKKLASWRNLSTNSHFFLLNIYLNTCRNENYATQINVFEAVVDHFVVEVIHPFVIIRRYNSLLGQTVSGKSTPTVRVSEGQNYCIDEILRNIALKCFFNAKFIQLAF